MPTTITSAQVAAVYGLSSAPSVELPLSARLEQALGCLQSLEACQAQGWAELPPALWQETTQQAFAALRRLPQVVAPEDLKLLQDSVTDARRFAEETSKLRSGLAAQWNSVLQMEEAARADQLSMMTRIVAGAGPYAGLPDVRSIVAYSRVPEWARRIAYGDNQEKGLDLNAQGEGLFHPDGMDVSMAFQFGRYWVRDARDSSILDLRNILRSGGGIYVGKDLALRLKPGVLWPVTPGDAVRMGKKTGVTLRMPAAPRLETLRAAIAVAPSLAELSQLLTAAGLMDVAAQVNRYLKDKTPFENLPTEGGLALKVAELVLKAEFRRLQERYMPQTPEGSASQAFRSLVLAMDAAQSGDDLISAVKTSSLPSAAAMSEGVALFIRKPTKASANGITTDFAMRERALAFSKKAAEHLDKSVGELQRRVTALTKELETTTTQLAEKTAALAAAEAAAEEEAKRQAKERADRKARERILQREREREEEQRKKADQEKDERHEQEKREQEDRRRRELAELEEKADAEKGAIAKTNEELTQRMEILEGARAGLQKDKEALEMAVARITQEIELARGELEGTRRELEAANRRYEEKRGEHLDLVTEKMEVDEKLRIAQEEAIRLRAALEAVKKLPPENLLVPGRNVLLDGSRVSGYLIGRGRQADIRLEVMNVSRAHFQLRLSSKTTVLKHDSKGKPSEFSPTVYTWEIKDRSGFGTRVNGEEVTGWRPLKDGEAIGMGARGGESRLVFQHPDPLARDAQLIYPIYQSLTSDDLEAFLMKHASVPNEGPVSVLFGPWEGEHVRKQEVVEAIQAFARLLANTPELESFFTPQAISDAKTTGKEVALFEKAEQTIRGLDGDRNSDQFREFAFGDLELIKAIEPPFVSERDALKVTRVIFETVPGKKKAEARRVEVDLVQEMMSADNHKQIFEALFGGEAENAAYFFTLLQQNAPEVASSFTPKRLWHEMQKDGKEGIGKYFAEFSEALDPTGHMTGQERYRQASEVLTEIFSIVRSPRQIKVRISTTQPPVNGEYYVVGSSDEADSQITHSAVVARHAKVRKDEDGWWVAPIDDSQVFYGEDPMDADEYAALEPVTEVRLGNVSMIVSFADEENLEISQVVPVRTYKSAG